MSGFNFLRRVLDDAGGDFHRAQMARAFIEPTEYRQRFAWPEGPITLANGFAGVIHT